MRSFLKKQWPLLGLVILIIVVSFYLIKSGREAIHETFFDDVLPGEGLKLKDVYYAQDDPDRTVAWALNAKEMRSSGDKTSIYFYEFRLKVTPKGSPFLELTGGKGDYARDSGEINLWGDLVGYSGNGYKFISDHLLVNEKKGYLSTDKSVKIFGPFFHVEGRGLFVDLQKKTLRIHSDVKAVIEKEPLT